MMASFAELTSDVIGNVLECGTSWVCAPVESNQILSIGVCYVSAKNTALRNNSKDSLHRNQGVRVVRHVYPRSVVSMGWYYEHI